MVPQQTQKMLLSPQMRQYLKLLELPLLQLAQRVELELEENPLLEETDATEKVEDPSLTSEDGASTSKEKNTEELKFEGSFDPFEQLDENFRDTYEYPDGAKTDPREVQKRRDFHESLITKPEALSDFLLWQVRFLNLTASKKKIAEELIGNIDEDGYLRATVEEVAQATEAPPADVLSILQQIQQLDPPGIGARNLQEALLIQLQKKASDPQAALAIEIVGNHFDLLKKRDWPQLAKIFTTDIGRVQRAAALISRLEPHPGRTFYSEEPTAVIPDAIVTLDEEKGDGTLKIEVRDDAVPSLRINPYYRHLLRKKDVDEKTKAFVQEKMASAMQFLKALNLRKSTLQEITEELVRIQKDFFEKGFSRLRPLRLKDIAQALGIHESTVSRALRGKYISTPQGTIPYKSFFSSRLETLHGEDESQKSIMEKIRGLVENENPRQPLSDQEIVRLLRNEEIVIARRTVAKYRDLLKILPSHLRRSH